MDFKWYNIQIPLECKTAFEGPRLNETLKRSTTILDNIPQKVQKLPEKPDTYTEEAETTPVYPIGPKWYNSTAPHDGIVLHITESDDKLFPETHIEIQEEIKETRKSVTEQCLEDYRWSGLHGFWRRI